jgi:hypothetical protein
MLLPFFSLAVVAPNRQRALRGAMMTHVAALSGLFFITVFTRLNAQIVGNAVLVAGIVEGALLLGWRLTQLPKSQALEFLLVSPLRPAQLLVAEGLVGLARLGLVTLAGLPVLILFILEGQLLAGDLPALLLMPFTWGAVAGLGLTAWAYEPAPVRRWGERAMGALIVLYLVVGVLAAENLPVWLAGLPDGLARWFLWSFRSLHDYNPFGVMRFAMEVSPDWAWPRVMWSVTTGLFLAVALLTRAALRLHQHFQDEHYRPILRVDDARRTPVGDRPLTWWAVQRVSRYSGRINLWLAGGFGLLYGVYTVAEPHWPVWLGRQVFVVFENLGGIPMVATALVLLAGVPAAFQYGLWDASAEDRCRRLELLLLTRLDGRAYWDAAAAAAWTRGRGYFAVALGLWFAAWLPGRASSLQVAAGVAAGVLLWGLYFAAGFRAFSRGVQAGGLGVTLTLLLPLLACLLARAGWPMLAGWLPPGNVYFGFADTPGPAWAAGAMMAGLVALWLGRRAQQGCERDLRNWYAAHHSAASSPAG